MFAGIQRERDPNLIKLEIDVFNQLRTIGDENDKLLGIEPEKKTFSNILPTSLSVEDALKELIEMEKSLK